MQSRWSTGRKRCRGDALTAAAEEEFRKQLKLLIGPSPVCILSGLKLGRCRPKQRRKPGVAGGDGTGPVQLELDVGEDSMIESASLQLAQTRAGPACPLTVIARSPHTTQSCTARQTRIN